MNYQAHPKAIIEPGALIGDRTRVWANAHILPGARIGSDCNICDNVFIENDVIVGDRVTIKCGVQLWDGARVLDDVFIGPNATFTNDVFPRSKDYLNKYPNTILEPGCSVGANATILPGVVIGRNAMVGAGSVVTKSVPPNAIVVGNPAEITGYERKNARGAPTATASRRAVGKISSRVNGVELYDMPLIQDLRGDLSVGEFARLVPFFPKRYFLVFNVKNREIRGEHAHRKCQQFLVCVAGSCKVAVDNGFTRDEFFLDDKTKGLYLPPMIWGTQYKYSPDGVLLVFASDHYDPDDYIRNYEEFLRAVSQRSIGRHEDVADLHE